MVRVGKRHGRLCEACEVGSKGRFSMKILARRLPQSSRVEIGCCGQSIRSRFKARPARTAPSVECRAFFMPDNATRRVRPSRRGARPRLAVADRYVTAPFATNGSSRWFFTSRRYCPTRASSVDAQSARRRARRGRRASAVVRVHALADAVRDCRRRGPASLSPRASADARRAAPTC